MKRIIFILNNIADTHCKNRIDEFKSAGYSVEIYGFQRSDKFVSDLTNINILANIKSGENNYLKRIFIIPQALFHIFKKYKKDNVIYYFFGLDIAFLGLFFGKKYIYEEADMTHLNIKYRMLCKILEYCDKLVIRKSLETILTSEGFVRYHFKTYMPDNISIVTNRLNPVIKEIPVINKQSANHIRFGFAGCIRYRSIFRFVDIVSASFPDHTFSFYGYCPNDKDNEHLVSLCQRENVRYYGMYKNPEDLPVIYSQIDMVLAIYDISKENVRWAEPNKLYEAIYFNTPIIVSKDTFLAEKVLQLGIGYKIDANNKEEIIEFVKNLSHSDIKNKAVKCNSIDKNYCINRNTNLFQKLSKKLL